MWLPWTPIGGSSSGAREGHAEAVRKGRLILVHCAVGMEEGSIQFHLSTCTLWNSLKREITDRNSSHQETVMVPARRLSALLREYGIPLYCKIDVEGYDAACLAALEESSDLPCFISVETECIAQGEQLNDEGALETLERLRKLGYRRFKLVDQRSLAVLSPFGRDIYRERAPLWRRVLKRLRVIDFGFYNGCQFIIENRQRLSKLRGYNFPDGSSGPFGDDLEGNWIDYDMARKALLRHRRNYFCASQALSYGFWCDWHAVL